MPTAAILIKTSSSRGHSRSSCSSCSGARGERATAALIFMSVAGMQNVSSTSAVHRRQRPGNRPAGRERKRPTAEILYPRQAESPHRLTRNMPERVSRRRCRPGTRSAPHSRRRSPVRSQTRRTSADAADRAACARSRSSFGRWHCGGCTTTWGSSTTRQDGSNAQIIHSGPGCYPCPRSE